MQFFDTNKGNPRNRQNDPYAIYEYADFTNFGGAMLLLF